MASQRHFEMHSGNHQAGGQVKLHRALTRAGLQEVRFRFDFEGTKLVIS